MKKLAQNLKRIRKERWRLSQDRFSVIMDSTRSKINSYENGGVEPSIAFVLKLQSFTNLSVQEIFYEDLTLDQIPPFPLEIDPNAKKVGLVEEKPSEMDELLQNQKTIQKSLAELSNQLKSVLKKIEEK